VREDLSVATESHSAAIEGHQAEEDSTLPRRAFQEETSTISVTKTRAESTE
jgi:hypothetical protein